MVARPYACALAVEDDPVTTLPAEAVVVAMQTPTPRWQRELNQVSSHHADASVPRVSRHVIDIDVCAVVLPACQIPVAVPYPTECGDDSDDCHQQRHAAWRHRHEVMVEIPL